MTDKRLKKIMNQAHKNLTTKKGRPEYAPDVHEIQKEFDKLLLFKKKKHEKL